MLRESQAICTFCGRPASDRFTEAVGWFERRSAGGRNHIEFPRDTGRRCCEMCWTDMRTGVAPNSPRLF